MNSREIVRRTVDFDHPERLAHSFPESDFILTGGRCAEYFTTDWELVGKNRWERRDLWGNIWRRVDPTSSGEVAVPVLKNIQDADSYTFPDFSRPEDYEPVRQDRAESPDKWLVGGIPGFIFSIARKMFSLEEYLVYLLTEKESIHRFHDKIEAMILPAVVQLAEAGVDSIFFCEDWGTQTGPLVGPKTWREEFFPRFQRLCDTAHNAGIKVFMHSCGCINQLMPMMIEAGIDAFQFDQPGLHGIDILADYQKDAKVTFWSPVDIQKTLPLKDEKVIRAKAREMVDKLWQGRGGFIGGRYVDEKTLGLEPKWQDIASEEFMRRGKRENYQSIASS
jgi:hypothetical protein